MSWWWLKRAKLVSKAVCCTVPSTLVGEQGFWMCGFIPGYITLPGLPLCAALRQTSAGYGEKLSLLCALCQGDLYFCSALLVLVIEVNSLLKWHLFISRKPSRFRTSSAALVPSGGNVEDGKIKKMNQPISL